MDFMIGVSEFEGKNISKSGPIKILISVGGIGCWSHNLLDFMMIVNGYDRDKCVFNETVFPVANWALFLGIFLNMLWLYLEITGFFIFNF